MRRWFIGFGEEEVGKFRGFFGGEMEIRHAGPGEMGFRRAQKLGQFSRSKFLRHMFQADLRQKIFVRGVVAADTMKLVEKAFVLLVLVGRSVVISKI